MELPDPLTLRILERISIHVMMLASFLGGFIMVIRTTNRLQLEVSKERVLLNNASPALLAMLLGVVLAGLSLYSRYEKTDEGAVLLNAPRPSSNRETGSTSGSVPIANSEAERKLSLFIDFHILSKDGEYTQKGIVSRDFKYAFSLLVSELNDDSLNQDQQNRLVEFENAVPGFREFRLSVLER